MTAGIAKNLAAALDRFCKVALSLQAE